MYKSCSFRLIQRETHDRYGTKGHGQEAFPFSEETLKVTHSAGKAPEDCGVLVSTLTCEVSFGPPNNDIFIITASFLHSSFLLSFALSHHQLIIFCKILKRVKISHNSTHSKASSGTGPRECHFRSQRENSSCLDRFSSKLEP